MSLIRRTMFFIDGENLVCRYQAMLNDGWQARDGVHHEPDVYVWHEHIIHNVFGRVIRATYYTSVVGDETRLRDVSRQIQNIGLSYRAERTTVNNNLTAAVYKQKRSGSKSNALDIQLTIDAVRHAHNRTMDAAIFVTGDGDFIPVIKEVMSQGVEAYVYSLSSGLHPDIPIASDRFELLDDKLLVKPDQ